MRKCKEMWDNTLAELAIPSDALNKLLQLYDEENVLKTNFMKRTDSALTSHSANMDMITSKLFAIV